jgi:transglutaminase-like putative cysteine protease
MRLRAHSEINLESPEPAALIAMLRPRSGAGQWIVSEAYDLRPFVGAVEYVDGFGNLCQRLLMPKGTLQLNVDCTVECTDSIDTAPDAPFTPPEQLPDSALQFLLPSRYCPSDRMSDSANELVARVEPGYPRVEAIRTWIQQNVEYRRGSSNESTTGLDTFEQRAGVCRDFAHVGISLCRSLFIPARMVVGYLHRLEPMDLHAWFEAFVGGRWYTFDATQAKPRGGRIVVAYGRDAADVALTTPFGPISLKSMNVRVEELR